MYSLHLESESDLQKDWRNPKISIEEMERISRERFQRKDYHLYFPLTKTDLIQLQERRMEIIQEELEYKREKEENL